MSNFTVLLDMDSTVYDLLIPTLEYIEDVYGKRLTPFHITSWRWDKEHNVDPFPFWNTQGTYLNLKPFPHAIEAIKKVADMGIRQVFLSSANFTYATEKFKAVERDFPFIGAKDVLLTGGNKDLVKGDVLVDDGPHNLEQFEGYKVLADMYQAPYCKFRGADDVLMDWKKYPSIISILERWHKSIG